MTEAAEGQAVDRGSGSRGLFVVARVGEIPAGGRKIVEINGRSIGIFHIGDEYFALLNKCPHQGGALCTGRLWGTLQSDRPGEFQYDPNQTVLTCVWHGWEFDLRTGQSLCEPERMHTRAYRVKRARGDELDQQQVTIAGKAYLHGPYRAETFPVLVDGEYIVVELAH
jgi:3-phenylpropionate/trans-cinnamate dioxygenase ferredoxin subunit